MCLPHGTEATTMRYWPEEGRDIYNIIHTESGLLIWAWVSNPSSLLCSECHSHQQLMWAQLCNVKSQLASPEPQFSMEENPKALNTQLYKLAFSPSPLGWPGHVIYREGAWWDAALEGPAALLLPPEPSCLDPAAPTVMDVSSSAASAFAHTGREHRRKSCWCCWSGQAWAEWAMRAALLGGCGFKGFSAHLLDSLSSYQLGYKMKGTPILRRKTTL